MTDLPFQPDPLKHNKNAGGHSFNLLDSSALVDTEPQLKLFLEGVPHSNGFYEVKATLESGMPLLVRATPYVKADIRHVRMYDPGDLKSPLREFIWIRPGGEESRVLIVGVRCKVTAVDPSVIPKPLLVSPPNQHVARPAAAVPEPEPSGSASSSSSAPAVAAPPADTKFCPDCKQKEPCECPECGECPQVCRCEKKKGGQQKEPGRMSYDDVHDALKSKKRAREEPNMLLFRTGFTDELNHPGMERVAWCHEWGKFQLRWVYKAYFRRGGEYENRPLPTDSWRNAANKTIWTPTKQPDPETGLAEYTSEEGDPSLYSWGTTEHQCFVDFLRGAIVFDSKGRQIGRTKSTEYTGVRD